MRSRAWGILGVNVLCIFLATELDTYLSPKSFT